jgi:ribosomal protein S6E (S10)
MKVLVTGGAGYEPGFSFQDGLRRTVEAAGDRVSSDLSTG